MVARTPSSPGPTPSEFRQVPVVPALAVAGVYGVGARDLRECLCIQARALEIRDPLVLRILDEQLETLIKRDFRGVARALGVTIEEVAEASHVIGRLEPRPGPA